MADFTGGVRNASVFSAMGKDMAVTTLSKTNMTQAELNTAIQFIELTTTVVGIGDDTAGGFNTGASDAVVVLTEGGVAPAAGGTFAGVTGLTASVTTFLTA